MTFLRVKIKKIMRGNSAPVNSCIEKTQNTKGSMSQGPRSSAALE